MLDGLFSNIGTKIKKVTKAFCLIGMAGSIIGGGICMIAGIASGEGAAVITGLVIAAVGALMSWLSSLAIYGFGELVENSCIQTEL